MHTQNNYTRKVVVPSSVNIKLEQGTLSVEGPLGTLQIDISLYDPSNLMNIQIKENLLIRSSSVKASQIVPATQTGTHPFNIIQIYVFSIFKN